MTELRLLTILCQDIVRSSCIETDDLHRKKTVTAKDALIQWLKERLPSTYMITNNDLYFDDIDFGGLIFQYSSSWK